MVFGSAVLARNYDEVLHSWGQAGAEVQPQFWAGELSAPTVGTFRSVSK